MFQKLYPLLLLTVLVFSVFSAALTAWALHPIVQVEGQPSEPWVGLWTAEEPSASWIEWHEKSEAAKWGAPIPQGRMGILALHPINVTESATLSRSLKLEADNPVLKLGVAAADIEGADWVLSILVNGEYLVKDRVVSGSEGWVDLSYNLSKYAHKNVNILIAMSAGGSHDWLWEQVFIDYITVTPIDEDASTTTTTTTTPPQVSILLEEDFNDGEAQAFGGETGGWKVVNGMYTATLGVFRFSLAGEPYWKDYVVEADFIHARDGGLLVRAQDQDNAIALIVKPNNNSIYWHVRKNGNWGYVLESVALGHQPGENLHVKLVAEDGEFKAYVNGELKTTLKTGEFPTGKIGLYLYTPQDQYWDNVKVYIVKPPTPTLNFELSIQPVEAVVSQGETAVFKVDVTFLEGFMLPVTLTLKGLPVGATCSFTPQTLTHTGRSTLTVETVETTPTGTYNLTVEGKSGSITQTGKITLTVNPKQAVTTKPQGKKTETLVYVKDYGKPGGSVISIPVYVSRAEKIGNMDFKVAYDGSVLKATGYRPGSLTASSLLEARIADGMVSVAFTDPKGINGDGTLIYIDFEVVGKTGASCTITPTITVANEFKTHTPLAISTKPGNFTVKGLQGDANGDGRITAVDALMALKMAVEKIPVDFVCDMNGDGRVTSLDATIIREKALTM
ncbi:MAG: hypothetical protein DRO52_00605 [Candidatus Hecatellales archaeon]|nr:MAG: hypothetical protein DRO52_00605 [Candidatus Hecatellales archaeon]